MKLFLVVAGVGGLTISSTHAQDLAEKAVVVRVDRLKSGVAPVWWTHDLCK